MTEDKLMAPLDDYLKAGIHIGTKNRNKDMANFIYKVRSDGLSIFNVDEINKRINIASEFISKYSPEDILIVCRRENGWDIVKLFSKITGIRSITGRYPPGILTNTNLINFIEAKLIITVDPWPDKNVVRDASKLGIPIVALCDTNNDAKNVDLVVPCNNKGKKSLGLVFFILAKEYLKKRGIIKDDKDFKYTVEEFSKE